MVFIIQIFYHDFSIGAREQTGCFIGLPPGERGNGERVDSPALPLKKTPVLCYTGKVNNELLYPFGHTGRKKGGSADEI